MSEGAIASCRRICGVEGCEWERERREKRICLSSVEVGKLPVPFPHTSLAPAGRCAAIEIQICVVIYLVVYLDLYLYVVLY